jgi:hypothetical protein
VPTTNTAGAEAHPGCAYATGGFEGLGGCSTYGAGDKCPVRVQGCVALPVAVIPALSGSAAACGQGLALG